MTIIVGVVGLLFFFFRVLSCHFEKPDFTMYKSRRLLFSPFVNIPLTTPSLGLISEFRNATTGLVSTL